MYEECCQVQRYQSGWRGEERGIAAVQHLVGKSSLAVRDIVSRSAGAVQQFMWQRYSIICIPTVLMMIMHVFLLPTTVFPQKVLADTINLSHRNNADTI